MKWLLIDDVKTWEQVLHISLYDETKEERYPDVEFHIAKDYHDGCEKIEEGGIDTIYLDWDLGNGLTGYDILHFLEEDPLNIPDKIICCSGHSKKITELVEELLKSKGNHRWWQDEDTVCCKNCGVVKREDGKNSHPCKGKAKIELSNKS